MNKKYSTIIKEGVTTPNGRLYKKGSLDKIKEFLQPYIDKNCCFTVLGADRDAFCMYNGYGVRELYTDKAVGLYSGLVKSFNINEGRGELEVDSIPTSAGHSFESMQEFGIDFSVDFDIAGIINESDSSVTIKDISPVVVLRRNESKN